MSHPRPHADELAVRYERATAITHLTRAVVIGRVTSAGPKLKYDERATPTCTFWLDVEESAKEGQTRHRSIPVEGLGKLAESVAESLEGGMACLVEGCFASRQASGKDAKEKAGLVVVSWSVTIATPALTRPVESQN